MTEPIRYISSREPRPDLLVPERDEHVWTVVACYRVSSETLRASDGGQLHLDKENLATIAAGCYVCEQAYQRRLTHRKCSGEPTS